MSWVDESNEGCGGDTGVENDRNGRGGGAGVVGRITRGELLYFLIYLFPKCKDNSCTLHGK